MNKISFKTCRKGEEMLQSTTVCRFFVCCLFLVSNEVVLDQTPVKYINTNIENGSPINWEIGDEGIVHIMQGYDYQRGDLNRTFVHLHFLLEAKAGSDIPIVIHNFSAIYNGKKSLEVPNRCVVSNDGKKWGYIPVEELDGYRMKIDIHMETEYYYFKKSIN